jgi:hypothetical protein
MYCSIRGDVAGCAVAVQTFQDLGATGALRLAAAARQYNAGGSMWYGQVKATQELAKDAFDAINNQVAFAP